MEGLKQQFGAFWGPFEDYLQRSHVSLGEVDPETDWDLMLFEVPWPAGRVPNVIQRSALKKAIKTYFEVRAEGCTRRSARRSVQTWSWFGWWVGIRLRRLEPSEPGAPRRPVRRPVPRMRARVPRPSPKYLGFLLSFVVEVGRPSEPFSSVVCLPGPCLRFEGVADTGQLTLQYLEEKTLSPLFVRCRPVLQILYDSGLAPKYNIPC